LSGLARKTRRSDGSGMHDLPPQGTLDDIFLPRLVAGLHLHEFEGSLRLTLPDCVKVLYFKRGEIASAASNADPDRLANILIQEGRLTVEQLELARTRMTPGSSLGKTLIEMGFLTPTELLQGALSLRDRRGRTSRDDCAVRRVVLALDLRGGAELLPPPGVAAPVAARGRFIPIVVQTPDAGPAPATAESADEERIEIEVEA